MNTRLSQVKIPKDLAPGSYVVGFRWDCEESNQVCTHSSPCYMYVCYSVCSAGANTLVTVLCVLVLVLHVQSPRTNGAKRERERGRGKGERGGGERGGGGCSAFVCAIRPPCVHPSNCSLRERAPTHYVGGCCVVWVQIWSSCSDIKLVAGKTITI